MSEIIMIVDVHCVTIWRYLDSTLRRYWVLPSNGNVSGYYMRADFLHSIVIAVALRI